MGALYVSLLVAIYNMDRLFVYCANLCEKNRESDTTQSFHSCLANLFSFFFVKR